MKKKLKLPLHKYGNFFDTTSAYMYGFRQRQQSSVDDTVGVCQKALFQNLFFNARGTKKFNFFSSMCEQTTELHIGIAPAPLPLLSQQLTKS